MCGNHCLIFSFLVYRKEKKGEYLFLKMVTKSDIVSALAYFDLFNYPLSQREIWQFLNNSCSNNEFNQSLAELIRCSKVYKFGEFYSLRNDEAVAEYRRNGNLRATRLMKTARKVSWLLSKFPFVRGVAISGSLSKNFANESSDIDLFIITSSNRLWLARTFLHGFKKLSYLFRLQHYLCMNYFVDEDGLEIEEKNIYTAVEVVTLIPLQGEAIFNRFRTSNSWSKYFLPNHFLRVSIAEDPGFFFLQFILEKMFANRFGDYLDNCLAKVTAARWRKKTIENKKNMKGIVMSMVAEKHVAKPDPIFFQRELLNLYTEKLIKVENHSDPEIALTK
jgi:predicted nucleotidyltransferase